MSILTRLQRRLTELMPSHAAPVAAMLDLALQLELSREFRQLQRELQASMPQNPAARGFKVYSQSDEDGIVQDICSTLGLEQGVFAEIGCGDGRENNTHYLLLKGWRGVWMDADSANMDALRHALPASSGLCLVEALVTRENVLQLLRPALESLDSGLDILSIDVDGNDLAIARSVAAAFRPKVIVGEYNAKFPYPMIAEIAYRPKQKWQGDDYHGASLGAWVRRLEPEYRLVSCNLAGTNAFFVQAQYIDRFGPYPPQKLYQPARFHLTALRAGHRPSLSYLKQTLADSGATR